MNDSNVYDFVILTEVKNREFETNCLLACELEMRGYKVKIIQSWEEAFYRHRPVNARVVVSWSMYNTRTFDHIASHVRKCNKMINMQREQLLSNGAAQNSSEKVFLGVHGKAKQAAHLAWGEHTKRRLLSAYHVDAHNIALTGDITLDMYREEFYPLVMEKEELCKKYNLNKEKKIVLFISSFTLNDLPEKVFDDLNLQSDDVRLRRDSIHSRNMILKWFQRILPTFHDGIVVYRPHPAEKNNQDLSKMQDQYSNFKVIGDEPIKQWIYISDKIYVWWSTSIKEIYASKKTCEILRPVDLGWKNEIQMLNKAQVTTNYEQFEKNFRRTMPFPVESKVMEDFLYIDEKEASYIKIANFFEEVLKSDSYKIDFQLPNSIAREVKRVTYNIKSKVLSAAYMLLNSTRQKAPKRVKDFLDSYTYNLEMKNKNFFTQKEYIQMKNKIGKIIKQKNK